MECLLCWSPSAIWVYSMVQWNPQNTQNNAFWWNLEQVRPSETALEDRMGELGNSLEHSLLFLCPPQGPGGGECWFAPRKHPLKPTPGYFKPQDLMVPVYLWTTPPWSYLVFFKLLCGRVDKLGRACQPIFARGRAVGHLLKSRFPGVSHVKANSVSLNRVIKLVGQGNAAPMGGSARCLAQSLVTVC